MPNISDDMNRSLVSAYGSGSNADLIRRFWVENGDPAASTFRDWYLSRGAVGTSFSDVEKDFWERIGAAMPLTNEAVFAIDARNSVVGETVVVNKGTGGTALNATLGSTGSADSNDPLLLPWTGENYVYVPGVAGSYIRGGASTSTINTTGDLEVVMRFALDDWAQSIAAGAGGVASKAEGVGQRGWWIRVANNSTILTWTADGTTSVAAATVTLPAWASGTAMWIKHTLDVDDGAGNRVHSVWYAPDQVVEPTSWTLAATNTVVGATSIFAGTDIIAFGTSTMASQQSSGKYKRLIIRHSIGGAKVFDLDLTTAVTSGAQTTVTDSVAGSTLAISRSTAGRKCVAVTRPVWLFGTDDYMEVPDNDLLDFGANQDYTVLAIVNTFGTPSTNEVFVGKGAYGNVGVSLVQNATTGNVAYQAGPPFASNFSYLTISSVTGLRLLAGGRSGSTAFGYADNTALTYVGGNVGGYQNLDVSDAYPLRIGANGGSTANAYANFELLAVAVFRRALTATEIASINTYFGTA